MKNFKKLKEQSDKLKVIGIKADLAEYIKDFVLLLNSDGIVLYANKAILSHLGYKAEEIEGLQFADFLHIEDVERTNKAFIKSQTDGSLGGFINRYKHKSGHYRWISWRQSISIGGITFGISEPYLV